MGPLFANAGGWARHAPADRCDQLRLVVALASELIGSEGSTTSISFDRWCEIHNTAAALLELADRPWFSRFDRLTDKWLEAALNDLESAYGVGEEGVA